MSSYYSIITCRDSETNIEKCIWSIYNQSLKPSFLIIVDDGSTDNTALILKRLKTEIPNLHVITNNNLGYDITRQPSNFNKAIKFINENRLKYTDYHMIANDDSIFELDYAQKLIKYMDTNKEIVFASGNYEDSKYSVPRGSGRFVRTSYFNRYLGKYPERLGYETAILHEAAMNNFGYSIVQNARYKHTRELGKNHNFLETGPIMNILGYHPLIAFNVFLVNFISGKPMGRKSAIRMLYDFLFYRPSKNEFDMKYDKGLRQYIRKKQIDQLKNIRFKRTSGLLKGKLKSLLNIMIMTRNN